MLKGHKLGNQKLGSQDFWRIANSVVLNQVKSAIPPLFNAWKMLSSASDKTKNCLLETILRTQILMTQASVYLFSLLELT